MQETDARVAKITSYLLAEASRELDELVETDVGDTTKLVYNKTRELYWTVTRLLGLGRLHDGVWRKPRPGVAALMRPQLMGDIPPPRKERRLLIDMTATHRFRQNTGIQRVVREIGRAAVESGGGLPVFIEDGRLFSHYRHPALPDEVTVREGDQFLLLDASWYLRHEYLPVVDGVARAKGEIVACLYDLIPILYPATVTRETAASFKPWFDLIVEKSDVIVGISKSVIDEFADHARSAALPTKPNLRLGWWHLGADFRAPSAAPSAETAKIANEDAPFFLSVGTLEPRKAYGVALDAFEALWRNGSDARFVILGRRGWNTRALQRRIREHVEFGRKLFWLDAAADADLHYLYRRARALVFPSFVEGFGLPLIEAAHFGAPVIASDIPVFREVGGDGIAYFDLLDANSLAMRLWEALAGERRPMRPSILSWRESTRALVELLQADGDVAPTDIRGSSLRLSSFRAPA
jgi:glycosyltransferase involved in cell wall biosynthesis